MAKPEKSKKGDKVRVQFEGTVVNTEDRGGQYWETNLGYRFLVLRAITLEERPLSSCWLCLDVDSSNSMRVIETAFVFFKRLA